VGEIHHEIELGLVIGRRCKRIPETEAMDAIAGYTLAIDVTARDVQLEAKRAGMPWSVSKVARTPSFFPWCTLFVQVAA